MRALQRWPLVEAGAVHPMCSFTLMAIHVFSNLIYKCGLVGGLHLCSTNDQLNQMFKVHLWVRH